MSCAWVSMKRGGCNFGGSKTGTVLCPKRAAVVLQLIPKLKESVPPPPPPLTRGLGKRRERCGCLPTFNKGAPGIPTYLVTATCTCKWAQIGVLNRRKTARLSN